MSPPLGSRVSKGRELLSYDKSPFSIIITTYNRFDYLIEAVRSVSSQSFPPRELIVVDDGSTISVEQKWSQETPVTIQFPVRFMRTPGLGPSAARNVGAKISRAPILSFLDDDDLFAARYLEKSLVYFSDFNADALITWLRCFDKRNEWAGKHIPKNHVDLDPFATNIGVVASNLIVCRKLFDTLGGFDERLRGSEDKDFYIRAKNEGSRIFVQEEELVLYRVHPENQLSGSNRFHWTQEQGKSIFLEKYNAVMPKNTYQKLMGQLGQYRFFGSRDWRKRLNGLFLMLRHQPSLLLEALLSALSRFRHAYWRSRISAISRTKR